MFAAQAPPTFPNSSAFTLSDQTGSSPSVVCQDPVAQNYQKGPGSTCIYTPSTSTNNVTTTTKFTLYANKMTQPSPKFMFLSWGDQLSSGATAIATDTSTPLDSKFIFSFAMKNCPFTNLPERVGGQIYYGDYVQLAVAGRQPTEYFSPINHYGSNGFNTDPGNCTPGDQRTFQILKIDPTSGIPTTAKNDPVMFFDEIALVQAGGPVKGWTINIGKSNTAGLVQGNWVQPQNWSETKMLPMTMDDLIIEYKKGNGSDDHFTDVLGWIIIAIVLVLLGLYFLKLMNKK